MNAELHQAVKDVGEAAKARNAKAADQMYDALYAIKQELDQSRPSIAYLRAVAARAIPK